MNLDKPGRTSGRVLPLKGSEHTAIDGLLPFYINGTLQGEELDRVKQHLAGCEQCRREVDWLREIFAACEAIAPLPETPLVADPARIPALAGRIEPRGWRGRISAGWAATQPWARMAMAAQLAGLVVLGAMLASESHDEAAYRTLGAYTRPAAAGDSIAVMFDPAITEGEMRRLLDGAGARIIDGPTATAAFVLEVAPGHAGAAVQKLRADRRVLFAEPLGAQTGR
jgi:hypothetical protein